eukprot:1314922-Amorphochlora_amoeboformis.AAC.1
MLLPPTKLAHQQPILQFLPSLHLRVHFVKSNRTQAERVVVATRDLSDDIRQYPLDELRKLIALQTVVTELARLANSPREQNSTVRERLGVVSTTRDFANIFVLKD